MPSNKEEAAARTITVSGPLGSGKTTVAHLLTDFMRSHGIEVELGEMPEYDRKQLSESMVEKPSETTTRWWPVRMEVRHAGKVG